MIEESRSGFDRIRHTVGVPLAVLLSLAVWYATTPQGLSPEGHKALALFAGIFVLYLTETIPLAVSSLMVVPAAVLIGLVNVKGALEGFASSSVYLIVGAFVLATAMVKTRLAERTTYRILDRIGCSPTRITLGVTLANVCLAFLVPSSTARTAILPPVCLSIVALLAKEERSRFAVNLLLTLTFTNATISAGILTATVPNPVTVEFLTKAGATGINYVSWLKYGFPPALVMTFVTWGMIQWVFKPEPSLASGGAGAMIRESLRAIDRARDGADRAREPPGAGAAGGDDHGRVSPADVLQHASQHLRVRHLQAPRRGLPARRHRDLRHRLRRVRALRRDLLAVARPVLTGAAEADVFPR